MNSKLLDRVCEENCVHPFWVIHEAYQYLGNPDSAWRAKQLCKHWKKIEVLPEEVNDFCLDVLAGRTKLRQPERRIQLAIT